MAKPRVEWREPPFQPRGGARNTIVTPEILAVLQRRPGHWARIYGPVQNRGISSQVAVWRLKFPAVEFATRTENGGYNVYARWKKS